MIKKYRANTEIGINVVLSSGKSMRISFTPLTVGGSVYYTDDTDIQRALERHYKFGKLFTLESQIAPQESNINGSATNDHNAAQFDGDTTDTPNEEVRVMTFSDLSSAKEYICSTYGLARTKLRSQKSIEEAALSFGIKLQYE